MARIIGCKEEFIVEFHFYENGIFLTKEGEGHLAPKDRICGDIDLDGSLYKCHFGSKSKRLYVMING